jgi:CRP-like cAMP-binding protein
MFASGRFSPAMGNRLLAQLPRTESRRLRSHLEVVSLSFKQVLYEPGEPAGQLYFPTRGVIALLAVMQDGTSVEVASVGREGMVGLAALLGDRTSSHRVLVQFPGDALRLRADVLDDWASRGDSLAQRLSCYIDNFLAHVAQMAACNALHSLEQRCCRWLLMTRDRLGDDEFFLTHRFLAQMLGVRRAGVTEVAGSLQRKGLIRYRRGKVAIVDRPGLIKTSCECCRAIQNMLAIEKGPILPRHPTSVRHRTD